MYELLALNPPVGGRGSKKKRGGARRSGKKSRRSAMARVRSFRIRVPRGAGGRFVCARPSKRRKAAPKRRKAKSKRRASTGHHYVYRKHPKRTTGRTSSKRSAAAKAAWARRRAGKSSGGGGGTDYQGLFASKMPGSIIGGTAYGMNPGRRRRRRAKAHNPKRRRRHARHHNPKRRRRHARHHNPRRKRRTSRGVGRGRRLHRRGRRRHAAFSPRLLLGRRRGRRNGRALRVSKRQRRILMRMIPHGRRRRKGGRMAFYLNPKRRRRHARHHNPRRRRHHAHHRHHNPSFRIAGFELGHVVNYAVDGAVIGLGLSAALLLPKQVCSLLGKPQFNQGWYGVGASALSTGIVASAVGAFGSRRLASFVGLGGAVATLIRAATMFAPAKVNQFLLGPIQGSVLGGAIASAPPQSAPSKGTQGYGDSPFFSARDIINGERGVRDWVQTPMLPATGFPRRGVSDWVNMDVAPSAGSANPSSGGEAF